MTKARAAIAAIVTTVALGILCCVGVTGVIIYSTVFGADDNKNQSDASFNCGQGALTDPSGKIPTLASYGVEQMKNAAIIIKVGSDMALPPRAWVIAIATAMQESRLTNLGNLGNRNDHDSLGLFQQRPSSGWGTPAQIMNPVYAATKFYAKLKTIAGWDRMPLTEAAQKVQRSAYPDAYAKHEPIATQIVNLLAHGAALTISDSVVKVCAAGLVGQISASGWTIPLKAVVGSGFRTPERPTHQGVDLIVGKNTPVHAASAGIVSVVKCDETHTGALDCDRDGYSGKGGCGWMVEIVHAGDVMTRYCHLVHQPPVRPGQQVKAGEVIAYSGSSGNSSGPHLHFEVHLNNNRASSGAIDPVPFMAEHGAPLDGKS